MPILEPSNPAISIVPDAFVSLLPENTISKSNAAPIIRGLSSAGFGKAYMRNATTLSAQIGRTVALTTGWPELELGKLANMTDAVMGGLPVAAVIEMFRTLSEAVPSVLKEVNTAIAEAISGVPIIGWLARIGFATWRLVEAAKNMKPTTDTLALGYSRELDQFATNELLDIARGEDWSAIFRPPQGSFSWQPIAYTSSGVADGVAWGQLEADGSPSSLRGVMPGVAAIAGYWQSPRNMAGSSRWAGRESIVGQGQMMPSVLALAGQLWATMQKPGSAFGRVDFVGLRSEWAEYAAELRAFAKAQHHKGNDRGEWLDAQIQAAFSYGDKFGGVFFGIAPASIPKTYREKHGGPDGFGLDALISYKIDQAWVRIVQQMGKGDAVAYMDPACPFLRSADSGLRKLHDDRRRELLQDWSSLARVDPTLVPDKDYREAIVSAQEHAPQRTPTPTPGQQGGAAPMPPLNIPAIVGLPPSVKPSKPGESEPDLPALPGSGGGGGAAAALVALAVLVLGVL